jgi:hypothetical protein
MQALSNVMKALVIKQGGVPPVVEEVPVPVPTE